MIEREPCGKELYYENVLANSGVSRWITQTSEEASASRTKAGYGIYRDIDVECASNVSTNLGKSAIGPLAIIENVVRAEMDEEYDRPMINYPTTLVSSWKQKEIYKNDIYNSESSSSSSSSSSSNSSKRKRNDGDSDTSKKTKIVA